ncbi:hypothetical protein B7P43_G13315 [Cryptotermes secundus]|uniref:Dynein assembly factor 3 C-terminal domain-containing protein n=2 Tax=Cryptotermes secundus TaxID=105785 RepID=A0A2J7R7A7_9NEOP|nr:hypothetical protein B7P43_G13315 [Cryptotermes secundus]
MKLRPAGAEHVTAREYKNWRNTGVAFTWLDMEATEPNLTLATAPVRIGDRLCHHGYLGDIVTGPFLAYCLDCADKDMLRVVNGVQSKRAADIAERNVFRMMHELLYGEPFIASRQANESSESVVITEVTDVVKRMQEDSRDLLDSSSCERDPAINGKREAAFAKETYSAIPIDSAEVIFLPVSAITDLPRKDKYKNFFHIITLSQKMTQFLTEDLMRLACEGGLLVVEGKVFLPELRKENLIEFAKNLNSTAEACHCVPATEFNPLKDSVAMFNVKRTSNPTSL